MWKNMGRSPNWSLFSLVVFSNFIQVEEARKQVTILESYLEQRGVALPKGYITYKIILPNPKLWYDFESPGNISSYKWCQFL